MSRKELIDYVADAVCWTGVLAVSIGIWLLISQVFITAQKLNW